MRDTNNSLLYNNPAAKFNQDYGFLLSSSHNNDLEFNHGGINVFGYGNSMTDFSLNYSHNNYLLNNTATRAGWDGFFLNNSNNNVLINNSIINYAGWDAFELVNSTGNNLTNNVGSDGGWYGFELTNSPSIFNMQT